MKVSESSECSVRNCQKKVPPADHYLPSSLSRTFSTLHFMRSITSSTCFESDRAKKRCNDELNMIQKLERELRGRRSNREGRPPWLAPAPSSWRPPSVASALVTDARRRGIPCPGFGRLYLLECWAFFFYEEIHLLEAISSCFLLWRTDRNKSRRRKAHPLLYIIHPFYFSQITFPCSIVKWRVSTKAF